MRIGAYSDRGRVKACNQDACCFLEATTSFGHVVMAVVCDGVGGLSSGEVASATVIRRFSDWFSTGLVALLRSGRKDSALLNVRDAWSKLLHTANEDIHTYGIAQSTMLGTTFTGMLIIDDKYLIGQVGDCRAYEMVDGVMRQLTEDQTFANYQLAHGFMTAEELANHPKRKMIMQSIGTQDSLEPVFTIGELNQRAVYVVCSDGIYRRMRDDDLSELIGLRDDEGRLDVQGCCAQLAWRVLERGERDNVTVMVFTSGAEVPSDAR